jgi:two-component system NtrC family sensor kinase
MSSISGSLPAIDPRAVPSLSQSDLELMADSIPHIVWMAAVDGSTDYLNQRGLDYSGYGPEANVSWDEGELVHPDDAKRERRAWEHAIGTQTPYNLDYRLRRFDGEYRWHAFRALPITDGRGVVLRWIGTATDIEDAKRSEADL